MSSAATQRTRQIAVDSPFGKDVLLLRRFDGREGISQLFEYELEMLSERSDLDPLQIVGHPVAWVMDHVGGQPRYFHGVVNRFAYVNQNAEFTVYRATVVPHLWLLTQTRDCRIFQNRTVPQIITQIFTELALTDFQAHLRSRYQPREYCVQYRETDFAFVSRLMEEEGIFYYFRHHARGHQLLLADQAAAYEELADGEVDFADPDSAGDLTDQILDWEHRYQYRPGRWAQTDYNFKKPSTDLMCKSPSVVNLPQNGNYEIYDYPGRFEEKSTGAARTRVRMEEHEVDHDIVLGRSTYRSFVPAGRFTVHTHRSAAELNRRYVLTTVQISASVAGSYDANLGGDLEERFDNRFTAIPANVVYRPPRVTPRPLVEGPQTAVVVGPEGEEIYPDEFGRVKVQFHWDREGQFNEKSSCWLRVSQVHAGQKWGGIDLPRIGEEVIVDFLEGDPDAPIITGRVYNGMNMPPFALPAGMTRSGMKSQTHKGSGYNEMSMDDTAGKEQIRVNGQHNMDTTVGNNQTLIVNVDRTESIGNNDALTVGVDSSENVGNNKKVVVGNNMNVDVGNKLVLTAGSSITLKCGASRIHMNSGGVITISGTIITTMAAANAAVVAPMTQVVGAAMLNTIGGINIMSGGVCHVGAAGLASVGGSKVDVVSSGKTSIKGGIITLN